MKIKSFCIIAVLLILPFIMLAQSFGDFDDKLLKQKESSIDPDAAYEYLYKEQYSKYELNRNGNYDLIVEHFIRIKIYADEGISQGNIKIPYYAKEELYAIKALSYNLIGTKRIEKSLAKKDIYFNKITEDDHEKTFAIPDVKKGSIIELKYKVRTPYIYVIPRFYFQEDVPVISAKYEVGLLKEFSLTPIPTGLVELEVSSEESNGNRIVSYVASNVPPLKDDNYVLNINDYRSSMKFELRSTKFSGDYIKYYSSTWNKIIENLLENRKFGSQIDAKIKDLKPFISNQKGGPQESIVTSCFDYIVENYNWNNKTSLYSNSVNKTVKNKAGDSGDLNMLLLNLLRKCGIKAYPYLTRQRNYGILNSAYPSLANLNYLLVCIEKKDGSYQFIDATNTSLPMNQLPMRGVNMTGFVVKDGKAIPFEMPNPNTYVSRASYTYSFSDDLEQLHGIGKKALKNYAAKDFRDQYEDNVDVEYQQDVQEEEFT